MFGDSYCKNLSSQYVGATWIPYQTNFLCNYLFYRKECIDIYCGRLSKIIIDKETNTLNRNCQFICDGINHVKHLFYCLHSWIKSVLGKKNDKSWEILQKEMNEHNEIEIFIPKFNAMGSASEHKIIAMDNNETNFTSIWGKREWSANHVIILFMPTVDNCIQDLVDEESDFREHTICNHVWENINDIIIQNKYHFNQCVDIAPDKLYGGWILIMPLEIESLTDINLLKNKEYLQGFTNTMIGIENECIGKSQKKLTINIFLQIPQQPCINNYCFVIIFVQRSNKKLMLHHVMYGIVPDSIIEKKNQSILQTLQNFTDNGCKMYGYLKFEDNVYCDYLINGETLNQFEIMTFHGIFFRSIFDLIKQNMIVICLNKKVNFGLSLMCFETVVYITKFIEQGREDFISIMYHFRKQEIEMLALPENICHFINCVTNPKLFIRKFNVNLMQQNCNQNQEKQNAIMKHLLKKPKTICKKKKKIKNKINKAKKIISFAQLTKYDKREMNYKYQEAVSKYGFNVFNAQNMIAKISDNFTGFFLFFIFVFSFFLMGVVS